MGQATTGNDINRPNLQPKHDNQATSGPDKDDVSTEKFIEDMNRFRERMAPYQRYIMVIGFTVLIILVVFLGYAYGGARVCSELDGLLDSNFKCHPGFYTQYQSCFDVFGQPRGLPGVILENGSK